MRFICSLAVFVAFFFTPAFAVRGAEGQQDKGPLSRTTDDGSAVYEVPVVFHIIHDYGPQYLPDRQVELSLEQVNQLFNKRNADTAAVIGPYQGFIPNSLIPYIGNARIRFRLAKKDPYGNPSSGITRTRSYLTKKGADVAKLGQWPPDRYLNIWVVNTMDVDHGSVAGYSSKPSSGDPHYDGILMLYDYLRSYNTLSRLLAKALGLIDTYGEYASGADCGDDGIDDTPPAKRGGSSFCSDAGSLYSTDCLSDHFNAGRLRLDSFKRSDGSFALHTDTATRRGITFECRTAGTLNSFAFYPAAAAGSRYKIGLLQSGKLIDSFEVISSAVNAVQYVYTAFALPASGKGTDLELCFLKNPGALRDTMNPAAYSKGKEGSVLFKNDGTAQYYNFFYDWEVRHGYYKMYAGDSLVDYPDTTNMQNVMDNDICNIMFTNGQIVHMRAALNSPAGNRNNLITAETHFFTGISDPDAGLAPKAAFSIERGLALFGMPTPEIVHFLCRDISTTASPYSFTFENRSWQAAATSVEWALKNGATIGPRAVSDTRISTRFTEAGWAKVSMLATNASGATVFTDSVFVADSIARNPVGYWQDFADDEDNKQWPVFNYYDNRYKWEISAHGVYDGRSMRYKSFDDRRFPESATGDAAGDYDDFFSPGFDLSNLGPDGNLNFMYAGAYATNDFSQMKDVLEIAYSTTCGGNWTLLTRMKDDELRTVAEAYSTKEYVPEYEHWRSKSIDLKSGSAPIRGARVFFRFRYKPSSRSVAGRQGKFASGSNFYIDRINISNNPLAVHEMILGEKDVLVAPNPSNTNAYVLFRQPNAQVSIRVTDMTGKVVYHTDATVDQGNAKIEIPAAYLAAKGVYMVRISGEGNLIRTEKLVIY